MKEEAKIETLNKNFFIKQLDGPPNAEKEDLGKYRIMNTLDGLDNGRELEDEAYI